MIKIVGSALIKNEDGKYLLLRVNKEIDDIVINNLLAITEEK